MSVGIARLREEADAIRQGAIDKGEDPTLIDAALASDERRRTLQGEGDTLRAERNSASKSIGEAIKGGARPDGPEVAGLRVWGSPWQPWFYDWAFNLPRGPALREKWDLIPYDTDVLITHGPPFGFLDGAARPASGWSDQDEVSVEHLGCEELRRALDRVRPRLHVFGHIHEGYGRGQLADTILVNASNCDEDYRPVNAPVVIDLP